MIAKYSTGHSKDKKLHMEAQQMAIDSKAKIEYLRMRLMKMKQVGLCPACTSSSPGAVIMIAGMGAGAAPFLFYAAPSLPLPPSAHEDPPVVCRRIMWQREE